MSYPIIALLTLVVMLAGSGSALAAIIGVTSAVDQFNTNGVCGLREAVIAANTNVAVDSCAAGSEFVVDTIVLQPGVTYNLTRSGLDDTALNGDLDLGGELVIRGNAAIIDANGDATGDRVFDVLAGSDVELQNLTVTDGRSIVFGGGIRTSGALTLSGVTVQGNISTGSSGGGIAVQAGTLAVDDSVIANNDAAAPGGGLAVLAGSATVGRSSFSDNSGGGILVANVATLLLTDCTVNGNDAPTDGGGILNQGDTALLRTAVSGNTAGTPGGTTDFGGGIFNSGELLLTASTVASNSADDSGGISNNGGTLTVRDSTIRGNTATSVGGVRNTNGGVARLVNSTVSGNTASASVGGVANSAGASLDLASVTIAFNTADADANNSGDGGGMVNNGTATLRNTLIGDNADASTSGNIFPDCSGGFTSAGNNLIENVAGCTIAGNTVGNITSQDPQLAALANNGGPTITHAFPSGAPQRDAGNGGGCRDAAGNLLASDQRGTARAQPTRCDIGALEFDNTPPTTLAITQLDANPTSLSLVRYRAEFSEPVTGVTPARFSLATTGITGASIVAITDLDGAGDTYVVQIATGSGSGTLQLVLSSPTGIRDLALNSVQGAFNGALPYTVDSSLPLFANGFE